MRSKAVEVIKSCIVGMQIPLKMREGFGYLKPVYWKESLVRLDSNLAQENGIAVYHAIC